MGKITGVKTPLFNHTSESTAYVVEDYPYGFKLRTRIRYWLESGKPGFRFVSQTENPKTSRWNAPKKSTYADRSAAMYLDDKGHVHWYGLTSYAGADEVLDFLQLFPGADVSHLRAFAKAKVGFLEKFASGAARITINGVVQEPSEADKERTRLDLEKWRLVDKTLDTLR